MIINVKTKRSSLTNYQKLLLVIIIIALPLPTYLVFAFGYAPILLLAITALTFLVGSGIVFVPVIIFHIAVYMYITYIFLKFIGKLISMTNNVMCQKLVLLTVCIVIISVGSLSIYMPIHENDYGPKNVFGLYSYYFHSFLYIDR